MTTKNNYYDGYLASKITQGREERAYADVDAVGAFASPWRDKLAVLRAYIITCLECQATADDLYSAKLAAYRKEFETTLAQARAAVVPEAGEAPASPLTIAFERG